MDEYQQHLKDVLIEILTMINCEEYEEAENIIITELHNLII